MNRNMSAYAEVDTINVNRSHWTRSWTHKTTFNAGQLFVMAFDEDIIPGTTIKHKTSALIRMSTPTYPTMDNLIFDYWAFRASKYWYWEHFKEQMGQNSLGAWSQTIEYTTPQIKVTTAYGPNDLATYMGIPQGISGFSYDRLGINFYCDVWNNWFRSQVVQAPIQIDKTDQDLTSDGTINTGYGLLPVCKTHDYFTSLLIEPQRSLPGMTGDGVTLPLGTTAPVVGNGTTLGLTSGSQNFAPRLGSGYLMYTDTKYGQAVGTSGTNNMAANPIDRMIGVTTDATKSGLIADLSQATAATLNALYLANATQQLLQYDALYGTIYRDILRGYGVVASSQDTMIPEYLGGQRVPINIETVLQNSETTANSPLGETGAFSVTASTNTDFTKSFSTHDMIIIVGAVRIAQHTYQQGLARQFKRLRRLDHYHPVLAHLANQPVYNEEIFLQADTVVDADGNPVNTNVFGYKEAWQEYLYKQNRVSGELSSLYAQSLDAWHYGDDYATLPIFGPDWIVEDLNLIDRTLAVTSQDANQFIADFYFEQEVTAPIPLSRFPGLTGFATM